MGGKGSGVRFMLKTIRKIVWDGGGASLCSLQEVLIGSGEDSRPVVFCEVVPDRCYLVVGL